VRRVLTLIRHGRVDFDARDAFRESPRGRQWDPPLGEEGRKQARLLAARLEASPPFSAIWCSPFRRCVETIEPYASATGMEIRSDERFGEVFVGEWEGLPFEEIVASDEQIARMFREQEAMFGLAPGGESGAELRSRVLPAVEELLETTEGDVAVVAHGGVINAYVASLLGLEQDMFFLPDNTSLNTVVVEEGAPRVRFLNDVRHITEPFVFVPSDKDKDVDEAG
jgi:probable phosphoglycerate mutase